MDQVQDFFIHERIISAAKKVEFITDRMSYILLRGHWYDSHAPSQSNLSLGSYGMHRCRDIFISEHQWVTCFPRANFSSKNWNINLHRHFKSLLLHPECHEDRDSSSETFLSTYKTVRCHKPGRNFFRDITDKSISFLLYCTVLAVLVGLQTTPLNLSHSFYSRLHRRYYNRSVANSSHTNWVDHSPFPSTLLTVDYLRWRPTIHRRLSALIVSSLANYSLPLLSLSNSLTLASLALP
jgi:hypothetical protein